MALELTQANLDKLIADNATLTTNAEKSVTDMSAMQTSITALEGKNREVLGKMADSKKAAEQAAHEATKKGGDTDALELSWQAKYDTDIGVKDTTIGELNGMIGKMTAGTAALTLANTLAVEGQAEGLLPHIAARLTTEIKDGKPTVRVLDKAGQPSALTIDDLKAEIISTTYLATMISGSKASGSGDIGDKGKGGAMENVTRSEWNAMNPSEQARVGKAAGKGEAKIID